jgi:hypothetical protein
VENRKTNIQFCSVDTFQVLCHNEMMENCGAPQQHKPGGQILQKQITEGPHSLPEREKAENIIQ